MHRKCACAISWWLVLHSMCVRAEEPPIPSEVAYEHAQAMRHEAEQMAATGATASDLERAAEHLEDALRYLSRGDVKDLATGHTSLYFRGHDVRLDLAEIYARLGAKQKALSMLESIEYFGWFPSSAEYLAKDAAFDGLREEPRFQAVLRTEAVPDRIWATAAFAGPYKEQLTVEERVAGLSLFWAEARQGFVYFDHAPNLSWDKVYMDFLSKVLSTENTRDYYRIMMQLAPLLHDGHTNIYPPQELYASFFARPPLETGKVADKVLVLAVRSPTLARRVHVGDEIAAIDGVPVAQFAEERVAPFVSTSTLQDRAVRVFGYQLLAGDAGETLTLHLRAASGKERDEIVARSGYTDVRQDPPFQFKVLANNVAYFALDHLESDAAVTAFEAALPTIMKARALVIDVRRNGGGSSKVGLDVLSYLSTEPIVGSISYVRAETSFERTQSTPHVRWEPLPGSGMTYRNVRSQIFAGPVAVLIGPHTFSAGEDFVVAYESMHRGVTVGEATGGSTGQPLFFDLPGGGRGRICVKRDVYPDGSDFVGIGVGPTIESKPSVDDVRAGRDVALARAVRQLLDRG